MSPDEPDPPEGVSDDSDPVSAGSDLRAKDLVGRSREELEAELDPATMAELASWFARPSMADVRAREVPDEVTAGASRQRDLDAFEALGLAMGELGDDSAEARARALAAIDPRMIDLFDRHTRAADALAPARPEPPQVIDETLLPAYVRALVVGEDETLPAIGEPRALQRSPDIDALLERDNAPQAVLRDLNRPVEEFERRLEPAFPPIAPEDDMTFAIREALRWRPLPVPPIEPVPNHRRELLPLLGQPWPELIASAKAIRKAEIDAADAQMQAEAEAGIVWRF